MRLTSNLFLMCPMGSCDNSNHTQPILQPCKLGYTTRTFIHNLLSVLALIIYYEDDFKENPIDFLWYSLTNTFRVVNRASTVYR